MYFLKMQINQKKTKTKQKQKQNKTKQNKTKQNKTKQNAPYFFFSDTCTECSFSIQNTIPKVTYLGPQLF